VTGLRTTRLGKALDSRKAQKFLISPVLRFVCLSIQSWSLDPGLGRSSRSVNIFASIWWQCQEFYSDASALHKAKRSSSYWLTGGGEEVEHHPLLTSAVDKRDWSTSRAGRFTHGKETRYPLHRRLGGFHTRSRWFWVREKSFVSAGFRTLDPGWGFTHFGDKYKNKSGDPTCMQTWNYSAGTGM